MQCLPSILSLFRDKFNELNNTVARMLDSIYHRTLKLLKITFLARKCQDSPSFTQRYNGRRYFMH